VIQRVAVSFSSKDDSATPGLFVAVCCSVLQHVAVCCNVLQCVAARQEELATPGLSSSRRYEPSIANEHMGLENEKMGIENEKLKMTGLELLEELIFYSPWHCLDFHLYHSRVSWSVDVLREMVC